MTCKNCRSLITHTRIGGRNVTDMSQRVVIKAQSGILWFKEGKVANQTNQANQKSLDLSHDLLLFRSPESYPSSLPGSEDIFHTQPLLSISFIPFMCPHLNLSHLVTWVHRPYPSDKVLRYLRSGKFVLCRIPSSLPFMKNVPHTYFFFGFWNLDKSQYPELSGIKFK